MRRRVFVPAACVAATLLSSACSAPPAAAPSGEWREFQGSWSASGRRHPIALERGGTAATVELSGAVVILTGDGLGRGFRGEMIGYDGSEGVSEGRAVWTDENGDRVYSRLQGVALERGQRITATITGGTGRYAGIEGDYSLTWQYMLADEDGIQARTAGLAGRVRRGGGPP